MSDAVATISGYHAHVYYDDATREVAARLRAELELLCPMRMGRWHDAPVGPHPRAMYQVAFRPADFPLVVPYLMLNRRGLVVFIHPETGRPRDDHAHHALWLGAVLPLDLTVLPETDTAVA